MDEQQPSPPRRKGKFTPKVPPPRKPTPVVPKTEVNSRKWNEAEAEAAQAQRLLNKFNENLRRQVPKAEKKSTVQVAFGPGATPSTSIRKFGVPVTESTGTDDGKLAISATSTVKEDRSSDGIDVLPLSIKKDYQEPWDYHHTYYPTTLPLRPPHSGNPELLNEAEFGDPATNSEYNENTINPALDLGLLGKDGERLLSFQLPSVLPHVKRTASAKGKEKVGSSNKSDSKNCSGLAGLPEGYIGKMLVYKSGAVKMKIGNVLYDVNPGVDTICAQDVIAVNTASKHCCVIGEPEKHAVVTIDVDSLLEAEAKPESWY